MTVLVSSSINVGALLIRGSVVWGDNTQEAPGLHLCAGYVVVESGGVFDLQVTDGSKTAVVYIKDNGAVHSVMRSRAFGGVGSAEVNVVGRQMRRTWSLLSRPASQGAQEITLLHAPSHMGWRVGSFSAGQKSFCNTFQSYLTHAIQLQAIAS